MIKVNPLLRVPSRVRVLIDAEAARRGVKWSVVAQEALAIGLLAQLCARVDDLRELARAEGEAVAAPKVVELLSYLEVARAELTRAAHERIDLGAPSAPPNRPMSAASYAEAARAVQSAIAPSKQRGQDEQ